MLSWVEPSLWTAAWLTGDLELCETRAATYRERGLRRLQPEFVASGAMGLGWAKLLQGTTSAVALLEKAVNVAPRDDRIGVRNDRVDRAGLGQDLNGRPRRRTTLSLEAVSNAHPGARWFDPLIAIGWGGCGSPKVTSSERGRCSPKPLALRRGRGQYPYALLAWHLDARLAPTAETARAVSAVAATTDGPLAPRVVAYVNALLRRDGNALDDISEEFEKIVCGCWPRSQPRQVVHPDIAAATALGLTVCGASCS